MPIFSIAPAGQYGLIADVAPHSAPLNSWSLVKNMHFLGTYAEKMLGHQAMFGGSSIAPYFLTTARPISGAAFWVYAGATAVYAYDTSHNDITRLSGPYTHHEWQGGVTNGLLYLNNGVDLPQVWSPASNTQPLVDLPNWPTNTTAAILRSFKNFVVALDVTKATIRDSRLVKWSHPTASGEYPTSWDETDPTKDAGEYSLSETDGACKDCLPLRDVNVIYKDDSIWGMSFVGGQDIFRFFNLFRNVGVLGKNCVTEFQTGQHLVFARDDIFVHNGQRIDPILRLKTRERIYNYMDSTHSDNSFVALDGAANEVWICFPETGHTYPNIALVWNWITGTTGIRELPSVSSIGFGIADETSGDDNWSTDTRSWDSDGAAWGQTSANPSQTRLVMAVPGTSQLYGILPDNTDFDGTAYDAILEKTGIGIPFKEGQPPDISSMKFCSNIWPQITGTIGGVVWVRFGTQMSVTDAPAWGEWQAFTIGTTTKIDVLATGRLFAIAFQSNSAISWKLQGYSLDVQYMGEY